MLKVIISSFLLSIFCTVNALQTNQLEPSIKWLIKDIQNCDIAIKKKLVGLKRLKKNSIINLNIRGCYSSVQKGEFLSYKYMEKTKTHIVSIKQLGKLVSFLVKEGGRIIDYVWIDKDGDALFIDRVDDQCSLPSVIFESTGDSYTLSEIPPNEGVIAVRRNCLNKPWYGSIE